MTERGSAKHGARQDDALAEELAGSVGPGGSNREEWADPEPPADDDLPWRRDLPAAVERPDPAADAAASDDPDAARANPDDAEMLRIQHDLAVANDWNPGSER